MIGILTVSDRCARGEREDRSGPLIRTWAENAFPDEGIVARIVPDEMDRIAGHLRTLAEEEGCRLILTTGGTGFGGRDITPEATLEVIEREVPGIPEFLRLEGLKKTPFAVLSRGRAGIRGKTLIINLPGSARAVTEGLETLIPILSHALELIEKGSLDCGRLPEVK